MNKSFVFLCLVALFVLAFAYQYEYNQNDEDDYSVLNDNDIEEALNANHQTLFEEDGNTESFEDEDADLMRYRHQMNLTLLHLPMEAEVAEYEDAEDLNDYEF